MQNFFFISNGKIEDIPKPWKKAIKDLKNCSCLYTSNLQIKSV